MNKDATEKAYSHFRKQRIGYKMILMAVIDEVTQSIYLYENEVSSEALAGCQKMFIKYKAVHQTHLKCIHDILHIHQMWIL